MANSSRLCGVLGDPIGHSLSPVLHRAGYAAVGLDWGYDAHRVRTGELAGFVDGLDARWRGLSVTMPLKQEAYARADRLTREAEMSGAVNTLVLEGTGSGGQVLGDNTDLPGAVAAVREATDADLRTAVVLGGGATATSMGLALVELGVERIALSVRSPERAESAARRLRAHPFRPEVVVTQLAAKTTSVPDIVVSTIPSGAQSPALVQALAATACVFEVTYDPWPTPLVEACEGIVISGLDLLLHQAALQFEIFTGIPAPLELMRTAGYEALTARAGTVQPGGEP